MAESLSRVMTELRETQRPGPDRGVHPVRTFEFSTPPRWQEVPRPPEPSELPARPVAIVFPLRIDGPPDPALFKALTPARDSLLHIVQRGVGLDVIDLDSLSRAARDRGAEVAITLRNSVQLMGSYEVRADSLVLRVVIRPPGWPVRGRSVQIESAMVPRAHPMAAVESVASKLEYMLKRATERP
jgi:hypothetical protein